MARYAPPAQNYLVNSLSRSRSIANNSAQENIGGAQTIDIPNTTVSATTTTTLFTYGSNATTTLSAAVTTATTSISVSDASNMSVGSVLVIGGTGNGEIQWVTAISGTTITVTPGLVNTHSDGANVYIAAAIQTECYTAQDPTGVDLGTNVVASFTASVQYPSTRITTTVGIIAVRTGFQYGGLGNVTANVALFGPQVQYLYDADNGSAGNAEYAISSTGLITLEYPTVTYDYTLSSSASASATSLSLSGHPSTSTGAELIVGDDDEPAELLYGTFSGSTFTPTNGPTQFAHASGSTAVNTTSSGESNWTFIPYIGAAYYSGSGSASATFYNATITIDPR